MEYIPLYYYWYKFYSLIKYINKYVYLILIYLSTYFIFTSFQLIYLYYISSIQVHSFISSTPLMLFFIIRIHQKFDSPFKNSTVTVEPLSNYLNNKLCSFENSTIFLLKKKEHQIKNNHLWKMVFLTLLRKVLQYRYL